MRTTEYICRHAPLDLLTHPHIQCKRRNFTQHVKKPKAYAVTCKQVAVWNDGGRDKGREGGGGQGGGL